MKNVLEENVSLQKQLITAENKLLASRLKMMPNTQDRGQCLNTYSFQVFEIKQVINVCAGGFLGQQTVPVELNVKKHTIQEGNGANEPQESYRSVSG